LPTEPSLMKLRGNLARKLREEEIRRRVEEVALRCRSLIDISPEEALKLVHQVLHDAPGNERLLALQSTIVGQMSERSQEQTRAQYLTRAHEALSAGRYTDALRLLESCQKEGASSPEIAELMDFARQEADRGLKNTQIQGLLRQAQDLMTRGSYTAVVQLLTPVKPEPDAASLMFLLEDARSRLQSLQRSVDAALQGAQILESQEQYPEAVRFLEAQPPTVQEAALVQKALSSLRLASDNESAALQAVGKAYAALDRPDASAGFLQNPSGAGVSLLGRIVPIFASRRKTVADRQLSSAIDQARAAIESGDRKQAARVLEAVVGFAEYASSGLHDEWQALSKKATKGRVFRKSG